MSSTAQKLITLEAWAEAHIEPAPSLHTLRSMARRGMFYPPAVKVGKAYYVEADARAVDPNRRLSLVERLQTT